MKKDILQDIIANKRIEVALAKTGRELTDLIGFR